MRGNIPYYLIVCGVFILLKFVFTLADNSDLAFLLIPTSQLVGLLTGSSSVYLAESGFFYENLNILIDKSCSGFNFWIVCFLVFSYLALKYCNKPLYKMLAIPSVWVFSYLLTIFVNTSRIFTSLVLQNQTASLLPNGQSLIHQAVGITINLSFLILAYSLIEQILIHRQKNAKLT